MLETVKQPEIAYLIDLASIPLILDYAVPNPSTCNIQDNFDASIVEAYFVQDKAVQGCEVDQTSKTSSVRQVHVIELHSASHEVLATPPRVIVDLTPIMRGKEHLYNVVLVLKADNAVSWDIRSVTVSGKLEILVSICTFCYIHNQIFPTSYMGLILHSTTVATAYQSTCEGTIRVLSEYPQSTLVETFKGAPVYGTHRSTVTCAT